MESWRQGWVEGWMSKQAGSLHRPAPPAASISPCSSQAGPVMCRAREQNENRRLMMMAELGSAGASLRAHRTSQVAPSETGQPPRSDPAPPLPLPCPASQPVFSKSAT